MPKKKIHRKNLPDYPVIFHANDRELMSRVPELATILDHFPLFEGESAGLIPEVHLQFASCGSSFGGESPRLTLKQLFAAWKAGRLIHSEYYDEDGYTRISEKLYIVGEGFGLSGFVFWGIVPARKTIVIADRCPTPREVGSIASSMIIYQRAAGGKSLEGEL